MSPTADETASKLLEATMLVMRSLGAQMRQGEQRLSPAHVGLLAKIGAGQCGMTELARHQGVRLPTISKSIGLLVERGWVERRIPEENRRQTIVRLTAEGRKALGAMKRRAEGHVADILAPLNAAQRGRVHKSLSLLVQILKPGDDRRERAGTQA